MTTGCDGAQEQLYESGFLEDVTSAGLRPGGLALTELALRACALPPGARVVDVGCGTAATVEHARRAHALAAIGVDASAVLLARARRRAPAAPLARADAGALPFRSDAADAVVMECSLSAMPAKAQVLAECARVLRPGGRLVLTDLYARQAVPAAAREAVGACCARIMTRGELERALARAGLEVDRWEDHSRALAELLGRCLLQHGSLSPFWARQGIAPGAEERARAELRRIQPGYGLVLATRRCT